MAGLTSISEIQDIQDEQDAPKTKKMLTVTKEEVGVAGK